MANPDFVEDEFEGAGLKPGLEVWYINDNVKPVSVPESYHGVFFSGCAYVLLRTHESDGSLSHDICCWLGEDLSQAQVESIKVTVLALHGALKYETTPSWMKQSEGCAGLFTYFGVQCMIFRIGRFIPDAEVRNSFLYVWIAHNRILQEVVCDRASLSNDCIFVLDMATKIFLFNCSEPVMEGPKKLVQQIKDIFHDGNCEMAVIGDGTLMTDGDTKEFWDFFGGYGPLPSNFSTKNFRGRLFCVVNGHATPMEVKLMKRDLLDTHKCYVVDSGMEVYVWMGIKSSLQERNSASAAAKYLLCSFRRPKSNIVRVIEESERLYFRMLFDYWPVSKKRSREVAGVNVKELLEAPSSKEDCNGILQVWRLDGDTKSPLMGADVSKFYSGDCYIFLYTYHGELGEEHFVGTWFGQQSLEEDRILTFSEAKKMVESLKFFPVQVAMSEGNEPMQFLSIFQNFIVYKGGLSTGYKKFIATKGLPDATYSEDGLSLFQVRKIGPKNIQAIQVEAVASSLNSSYCYILLDGSSVFTWFGETTTLEDHELVMRQLHLLKPNCQANPEKEGSESNIFWDTLGGKLEYPSEAIARKVLNKGSLYECWLPLDGSELKGKKMKRFDLDTLGTRGIFILDLQLDIYVWVGLEARSLHMDALTVAKEYLDLKNYSSPKDKFSIFIIMEGSEPVFFRRMFKRPVVKTAVQAVNCRKPLVIPRLQPMSEAVTELEAYVKGEDFQKEVVEFAVDRNLLKLYFADQNLEDLQATRKHLLRLLKAITFNLQEAASEHVCVDFNLAKEAREFIKAKKEKNSKRSRTD